MQLKYLQLNPSHRTWKLIKKKNKQTYEQTTKKTNTHKNNPLEEVSTMGHLHAQQDKRDNILFGDRVPDNQ